MIGCLGDLVEPLFEKPNLLLDHMTHIFPIVVAWIERSAELGPSNGHQVYMGAGREHGALGGARHTLSIIILVAERAVGEMGHYCHQGSKHQDDCDNFRQDRDGIPALSHSRAKRRNSAPARKWTAYKRITAGR
jgi:hypothetical protein